jgi:hypothetical protein
MVCLSGLNPFRRVVVCYFSFDACTLVVWCLRCVTVSVWQDRLLMRRREHLLRRHAHEFYVYLLSVDIYSSVWTMQSRQHVKLGFNLWLLHDYRASSAQAHWTRSKHWTETQHSWISSTDEYQSAEMSLGGKQQTESFPLGGLDQLLLLLLLLLFLFTPA